MTNAQFLCLRALIPHLVSHATRFVTPKALNLLQVPDMINSLDTYIFLCINMAGNMEESSAQGLQEAKHLLREVSILYWGKNPFLAIQTKALLL